MKQIYSKFPGREFTDCKDIVLKYNLIWSLLCVLHLVPFTHSMCIIILQSKKAKVQSEELKHLNKKADSQPLWPTLMRRNTVIILFTKLPPIGFFF